MQYKAVVFYLDGTLLYTLEDLYLATNHALKAMGLPAQGPIMRVISILFMLCPTVRRIHGKEPSS